MRQFCSDEEQKGLKSFKWKRTSELMRQFKPVVTNRTVKASPSFPARAATPQPAAVPQEAPGCLVELTCSEVTRWPFGAGCHELVMIQLP